MLALFMLRLLRVRDETAFFLLIANFRFRGGAFLFVGNAGLAVSGEGVT